MEVILYPVSTKFEFKILKFGNLKLSLLGIIINKSRKFESHSKVKLMTNQPKFFSVSYRRQLKCVWNLWDMIGLYEY